MEALPAVDGGVGAGLGILQTHMLGPCCLRTALRTSWWLLMVAADARFRLSQARGQLSAENMLTAGAAFGRFGCVGSYHEHVGEGTMSPSELLPLVLGYALRPPQQWQQCRQWQGISMTRCR